MSIHSLYTEPLPPFPKNPHRKKQRDTESEEPRIPFKPRDRPPSYYIRRHRLQRLAIENKGYHPPLAMKRFVGCVQTFNCFGTSQDRPINPTNNKATMNSTNIIPFDIPVGHLEPFETRPVVKLPGLPDIKNRKVLREILKIDKKMRDKPEGQSQITGDTAAETSGSRFKKAFTKTKGDEYSYARTGILIMDDVLEDIVGSKGMELDFDVQEQIKQSFLTDNQAHYFAICYRMEQHIHHYGDWGSVTTKELADVFRGYIGALSSESEIGLKGTHIWLHKLLENIVVNEIEYALWTAKHAQNAETMVKESSRSEYNEGLLDRGEDRSIMH